MGKILLKLVCCICMALILSGCPRYRTTLESYQSNPKYTKQQAMDICGHSAANARARAEDAYIASNQRYTSDCYESYTGGITCSTRRSSGGGGFWGGMAQGASQGMAGDSAFNSAMKACLAEKGWYKKSVRIN